MRFEDVPTDVSLYLLNYLGLDDVLHLLSTCSSLRKLADNRSLWIHILERTRSNGSHPLACPVGQDLSLLSLLDLQTIARRTLRLERNWSREHPRVIGAVRALRCEGFEGSFLALTVVPGTELLLLYVPPGDMFDPPSLACFDLQTGTSWPFPQIGSISCYSQYDECGMHFISMVHLMANTYFLDLYCVEYGPGMVIAPRRLFRQATPAIHVSTCLAVFYHADIVGMLYTTFQYLSLLIVNIHTNASLLSRRTISPFDPSMTTTASCLVKGDTVHIAVLLGSCTFLFFHCDISLPWGEASPNERLFNDSDGTVHPPHESSQHLSFHPILTQLMSPVGITAVYLQFPHSYSEQTTTAIVFRPNPPEMSHSPLVRLVLPGEARQSRPTGFTTASGNYLLVCTNSVTDDGNVQDDLHLVRFVKDPVAQIQVRRLMMPFFVESELALRKISSVAVDDHLGVVYLSHERGYIFAVPFA